MPVYQLVDELIFPPTERAEPCGLLALGGDLSPRRLLLAYSLGIFPWYNDGEPILWWAPEPRCVLDPAALRYSRSLRRSLRGHDFRVTFNQAFAAVMRACATMPRTVGPGTWITADMEQAYLRLHAMGYAHSVESWLGDELVGGLYGVGLGRCFFGESMFRFRSGASRVALVALCRRLVEVGVGLFDCQQPSPHLLALGARNIPRREFMARLRALEVRPSTSPRPMPALV
ncbi:leucyl/phenylalanyl-tRNA--protein transferase [Desulfuromonas sp. CSMB_57]|jgi:leucyl/phenylalanyl-tRNA--protein transferase|uniref:leucyl/phenylalanyl-tRNA--protein transferase n=1 Tax=Desulfuromonas sp. CSMB_57 TaxID=2807629 RepID=UPI001CD349CC|nr:leucyl/phenylalanyl-tRNA--protein transferase [Desulfuromonas sp. CSMB_57]